MSDVSSRGSTPSSKTATHLENCRLLRLPPELRNEIFHLALFGNGEADADNAEETEDEDQHGGKQRVDPNVALIRAALPTGAKPEGVNRVDDADGAISIMKPSPGITRSCKELRAETLPIFLGINKFLVPIEGLDDSGCVRWLKVVGVLPENVRRCIKSVVFRCSGGLFHESAPGWFGRRKYVPNFPFWENVIAHIRNAGLTAEQISWPVLDEKHTLSLSTALANAQSRDKTTQLHLLLSYVLPPLLREHGLASEHRGSGTICETLRVFTGFTSGAVLYDSALQAAEGDPKEWYQRWTERNLRARG